MSLAIRTALTQFPGFPNQSHITYYVILRDVAMCVCVCVAKY